MGPDFGRNTYVFYQTSSTNANTSVVSTGIIRLPLTSPSKLIVGDAILARDGNSHRMLFMNR